MLNLYQILGIPHQADQSQIRRAFKKLAVQYHPDKNQGNVQAEEKFKQINTAYQVLSDPWKKLEYDRMLLEGQKSEEPESQQHQYTGRYRDKYYQRKAGFQHQQNSTAPPYRGRKKEPQKPPMAPWEIIAWLGGGIALMSLFVFGLGGYLAGVEAQTKFEEANHAYYVENNPGLASKLLSDAIYRDEDFAEAYWLYAQIASKHGDNGRHALFLAIKSIELADTVTKEMLEVKAEAQVKAGQIKEAVKTYKQLIADSPDDLNVRQKLGEVLLYKLRDYKEASDVFQGVLANDSTQQQALLANGIALQKMQAFPQSNEYLLKAYEQNPKDGSVLYYMAMNELSYYKDTANACNQLHYAEELGVIQARYYIRMFCAPADSLGQVP